MEAQTNLIPSIIGAISALFAPRSEFAKRLALEIKELIERNEAELKGLKKRAEARGEEGEVVGEEEVFKALDV